LSEVNEHVGITAWAEDQDGSNSCVTYSLDEDAGGLFAIAPSTGVITLASTIPNLDATEYEITVRATSEDGSYSLRSYSIAMIRHADVLPEPEEIYLDEIIFDLDPTDVEETVQSTVTQSENDAEQASASAAEDEQSNEVPEAVPQTELEEPGSSVNESFSATLFNTDDRNVRFSSYENIRLTPTPVLLNELPQFDTLSSELIEVPETLWSLLDTMEQEMSEHRTETAESDGLVLQSATFGSFALSAGYVTWLIRAGALSGSLLSFAPMWLQIDPLPVLSARAKQRDTDQIETADEDPTEKRLFKLFERSNKNKHNRLINPEVES
jgi:hypothetical protein